MLYIITENYYLWVGLREAVASFETKWIKHILDKDELRSLGKGDLVIMDDNVMVDTIPDDIRYINSYPRYISFGMCDYDLDVNNLRLTEVSRVDSAIHKYRNLITSLIGNVTPSVRSSFSLSSREAEIINMTLQGMSANKIAIYLNVNVKTIYAHRVRACHKMGINRVHDIFLHKGRFLSSAFVEKLQGYPLIVT